MKIHPTSLIIREMEIKARLDITLQFSEWLLSKKENKNQMVVRMGRKGSLYAPIEEGKSV